MIDERMESEGSLSDILMEDTVQSADSFTLAREEARTAEKEQAQAVLRRKALLDSLRQIGHRTERGDFDPEAIRQKRLRIIRDGTAAEFEAELYQIRREFQLLKNKGNLSNAALKKLDHFSITSELFLEKKQLLEKLEKTLEYHREHSSDLDREAAAAVNTIDVDEDREATEKIQFLCNRVRKDIVALIQKIILVLGRLENQVESDLIKEIQSREFFHACVSVLDVSARKSIAGRAHLSCKNKPIDDRCRIYQHLSEELAARYPAVGKYLHEMMRRKARRQLLEKQPHEAVKVLLNALHLQRDDSETYRLLVKALHQAGDRERAFIALCELARLCPNEVELQEKIAAEWVQRGRRENAIEAYKSIIVRCPERLESRRKLAQLLYESQAYDSIPLYLKPYLESCPNDLEAHLWMGVSLVLLEKWERAVRHLQEARNQRVNQWLSSLFLSMAYRKLQLYDDALEAVNECQDHPSYQAQKYMILGDINVDCGRTVEAENAYLHALESCQPSVSLYLALGHVQQELGKLDEAEKSFRHACDLDAKSVESLLALGRILRQRKNTQEAETVLMQAIELQKDHMEARQELALLYIETERWALATQLLNPAPDASPSSHSSEREPRVNSV